MDKKEPKLKRLLKKTLTDRSFLQLLVGFVIALQLFIILFFSIAKPMLPPENVKLGNITDSSLAISWTTEKPIPSYLVISSEPNRILRSLGFSLCELFSYRCNIIPNEIPNPAATHLVSIKGLSENSSYYYRIVSGGRFFKYDKSGNILPAIKTGPILSTLPSPNPVYSYILGSDGKTPEIGALAIIALVGDNQKIKSSPLMTATDKEGLWLADLGNLRTLDLKNPIPVTLGDRLSITILSQNGIGSTSFVEYSQKELKPIIVKKASL